MSTRDTPARRSRRKRPVLRVIRSRDLPDETKERAQTTESTDELYWVMVASDYLVWPAPAKPSDELVFNKYGIMRLRGEAPPYDDAEYRVTLSNAEIDRIRTLYPSLAPRSVADARKMATFQLRQTCRSMGFDPDRIYRPGGDPPAS